VEVIGSANAWIDAELMAMGSMLMHGLGLSVSLELNSLGCQACRPGFRLALLDFLDLRHDGLCGDCKGRMVTNPLRVLDCKNSSCHHIVEDAPSIQEYLCSDCASHFGAVQDGLCQLGIPYSLNRFMVRGLDYYCRTTFEFITADLGSQLAVGAGGRYDGLVEQLGGPKVPGIGFAMGLERLILLLQQRKDRIIDSKEVDLFIAGLGESATKKSFSLANMLRKEGVRVAMDLDGHGLKSQMKQADKVNARYVLIIGDNELLRKIGTLRNMATQEQQEIALGEEALQLLMKAISRN
jgi:histidyl-tRNA synthetase